jgi:DNA-binding IclR family transcriptional regulator
MALGASFPLDSTGLGYAQLALLGPPEREEVLAALAAERGDVWPEAEARISQALREIAATGYVTSIGEWSGSLSGLAAPLTIPAAPQPLAISFLGAADAFGPQRLRAIAPAFTTLARNIEAAARERLVSPL